MTILSNYNGDIDSWRKMQFNSVKRGNFSGMAGHVNKVMDQAFQAGRETAVDNTAIARESIKGRSLERRAAMKAEGEVAQAGLKAFTKVKKTKNEVDSAEKIRDIMRPAKRMAGVVAGLGAISQAAVAHKNLKEDRAERAALKAEQQAVFDAQQALLADTRAQSRALMEQIKAGMNTTPPAPSGSTPPKPSGSAPTSSGSASTPTQVKPVASVSAPSGGPINAKSIADMARSAGAKYPKLVAAQWALESGWGTKPSGKNNYFGIKAGAGEQGTSKQTWEVYDGKEVNTSARFKNFDTPQGSVNELVSRWHQDYKGYRGVNNAADAFAAADMLTSEGYATDPNYAKKLKDIMSGFDF